MNSPVVRTDLERVRAFTKALRVALYDVQQEAATSGTPSPRSDYCYYYDADVSIRMIVGFEHLRTTHRRPSAEQDLVRALLSSGYLGEMILLPPHTWEVDDGVKRQVDFSEGTDLKVFIQRAEAYVNGNGIGTQLEKLSADLDDGVAHEEVLRTFATWAPQTFIALEAVNGTWPQRLHRYTQSGLLRFDAHGWDVQGLLQTTDGRRLAGAISEVRKQSLLNTLRDAAALTALVEMMNRPETFGHVRFYSESKTLWDILELPIDNKAGAPNIRSLLSYPSPAYGVDSIFDEDCRCILRSADYYLVRARFPALRFRGVDVREGDQSMSASDLQSVAAELEKLLQSPDSEHRLMSVPVGDKPLSEIIEELESFSFVGSIWQTYDLPDTIREYLNEWTNLWNFVRGRAVALIDRQLLDLGHKFHERLGLLRQWAEDLLSIQKSMKALRILCRGSATIPDPMRDLGLIRWGATLDKQHEKDLRQMVQALLDDSDTTANDLCQQVANWMHREALSGQNAIILCAILWLLSRFQLVVHAATKFSAPVDPSTAVSLEIIAAAALLRGALLVEPDEVQKKLDYLESAVQLRPAAEQSRYLLGLAYVHYYAWKNAGDNDVSRQWAKKSFQLAERAVNELQHSSLAWAFAVNHCVYVGYRSGMIEEAKPHRGQLIDIRENPEHWHFRFADTMAVTHLIAARERLRTFNPKVGPPTVLTFVENELRNAKRLLDGAEPSFGDSDVKAHVDDCAELQSDLDALRLDIEWTQPLSATPPITAAGA